MESSKGTRLSSRQSEEVLTLSLSVLMLANYQASKMKKYGQNWKDRGEFCTGTWMEEMEGRTVFRSTVGNHVTLVCSIAVG